MSSYNDNQDWTVVQLKRRITKKEAVQKGMTSVQQRDSERSEKIRLAKLDNSDDVTKPKKRVNSDSIQELIKKRIEMKLTQDKADALCAFPKHTFRDIESYRLIPSPQHLSKIQSRLNVQLRIDTIQPNT
jgi:ubiquinone biosynthesis protein COQ9